MAPTHPQFIFGGGSFMDQKHYLIEDIEETLKLLEDSGIKKIDTARIYGVSEEVLGKSGASSRFAVDTKYPGGFSPEPSSKTTVISAGEESLRQLQTNQVDVYYIHAPARDSSLEDVLAGINTLYKSGKFKSFGLSNFLPGEVEEVIRISRERNYILPTVYQGNYSAIARRVETELFPVLRKHNIAFYAYSPIAGGFLSKDVAQLIAGGKGRWDPSTSLGSLYHELYNKPGMLKGLQL
ncbi:NADP-dependent oxidoreductase domain-containing protein [Xylogone sp. PMI_703]|nr:NADP-dependent oxidoreductase domain-containing protein [Xylogone sp. PMI_703]